MLVVENNELAEPIERAHREPVPFNSIFPMPRVWWNTIRYSRIFLISLPGIRHARVSRRPFPFTCQMVSAAKTDQGMAGAKGELRFAQSADDKEFALQKCVGPSGKINAKGVRESRGRGRYRLDGSAF